MKKILFILAAYVFLISGYALADCVTGYACSIDELRNKALEQVSRQDYALKNEQLKELNDYFELKINEDYMLKKPLKNLQYRDLFPFSAAFI